MKTLFIQLFTALFAVTLLGIIAPTQELGEMVYQIGFRLIAIYFIIIKPLRMFILRSTT